MILVKWSEWSPLYFQIVKDLSLNADKDHEASIRYDRLLQNFDFDFQKAITTVEQLCDNPVVVFGAGPSLKHDIEKCDSILSNVTVIAADGAARPFIEKDITPEIVVTDLDGLIEEELLYLARKGSILVIHAHGDNHVSQSVLSMLSQSRNDTLIATIQTKPLSSRVKNFGGFTDGDRGVFLALFCGTPLLALAGFDLSVEASIGSYSKHSLPGHHSLSTVSPQKKKKLQIAKWLLEEHLPKGSTKLFDLSTVDTGEIKGFPRISVDKFKIPYEPKSR